MFPRTSCKGATLPQAQTRQTPSTSHTPANESKQTAQHGLNAQIKGALPGSVSQNPLSLSTRVSVIKNETGERRPRNRTCFPRSAKKTDPGVFGAVSSYRVGRAVGCGDLQGLGTSKTPRRNGAPRFPRRRWGQRLGINGCAFCAD